LWWLLAQPPHDTAGCQRRKRLSTKVKAKTNDTFYFVRLVYPRTFKRPIKALSFSWLALPYLTLPSSQAKQSERGLTWDQDSHRSIDRSMVAVESARQENAFDCGERNDALGEGAGVELITEELIVLCRLVGLDVIMHWLHSVKGGA
jgi:hypothetical protein